MLFRCSSGQAKYPGKSKVRNLSDSEAGRTRFLYPGRCHLGVLASRGPNEYSSRQGQKGGEGSYYEYMKESSKRTKKAYCIKIQPAPPYMRVQEEGKIDKIVGKRKLIKDVPQGISRGETMSRGEKKSKGPLNRKRSITKKKKESTNLNLYGAKEGVTGRGKGKKGGPTGKEKNLNL